MNEERRLAKRAREIRYWQVPENRDRRNLQRMLRRYGLSMSQYEVMLVQQGNRCAICGKTPEEVSIKLMKRLVVDHCHRTGKVRGLLCWRCNGAIGIIGEQNIERVITYLRNSGV